ncbi:hypothetical protein KQX54_019182 [Cotesia glomerata]|uniref:Secreted protein n=1 Tax=Cotesia glomerata TaxID=32391 RepID=A0AAV7IGT6_COTGL|nr:hypothetical protein KQX54_019182 [Cotesia glomerata]
MKVYWTFFFWLLLCAEYFFLCVFNEQHTGRSIALFSLLYACKLPDHYYFSEMGPRILEFPMLSCSILVRSFVDSFSFNQYQVERQSQPFILFWSNGLIVVDDREEKNEVYYD